MNHSPTFAIIGLGYIAERHLKAIKETGGEVVLAFDTHETGGRWGEFV
jgi:predicted dehydrogenase